MTTYTYEFTAFTEDALLSAGSENGSNLGYGDSFTMPASADTTFIVTDNDAYLSGDSWNNENANDSSYQTAEIIVDGQEAGNGGQVYGEQYFWVWGSSGQWYLMIEIEQEGSNDDYFTFYNAYGVPQEGETLTVSCGGNISNWQPNMNYLEAPAASIPPVAVLDAITITEGESIGDSSDDAQLNILANDFDTDGTISLTGVNGAEPGAVISVMTERGLTVEVTVDANGNLFFDTGADFDSLRVGESDSFELTYTITDNDGNEATSTVTVTIEGETTVDAANDVITVFESEGAGDLETLDSGADSVLANDTIDGVAYDGLVVTVNGQTGDVGQWIELEKGRVKLNADGTIDFDADGDFDALNDGESEAVTLNYTISAVEAGPDEYQCLFFNNLATGEVITDQFAAAGLTISSANPNNPVMIFDTANPTGGDNDLATSNLGKVLILSEDGDSSDPDDNAGGGTFIFEFDRAADIDSITMLDTEEPAPQIRLYGEDGMLLNTITGPVTADGGQGIANIDTAGVFRMEIELQGSGALDNLIYTIEGPSTVVAVDEATVTVNVLGEDDANANLPPDAVDDFFSTVETTPITGNVLTNDSDPDGDPISVIAVEGGEVGGQIAVTTAKGNTGFVTVGADGAFTFTPDENFTSLGQGETDSFDLTYTITDDPSTAAKTNLLFVLDVSNSTVGLNGQNVFDGVGVGDVNGDGRADTVLDAEIQAVISSVNKLLAQGIDPSMVDIGLVTFSGLVDLSRFAAPFNTPTADAETIGGDGTVYQLDSAALIPALQSILSGGWTNYEAGLQEAEGWLAANADTSEANKVIFLSDGRPIIDYVNGAYVSQDNSDYGDEVTRIVNNYGADIAAIGVGANSSLDALNDLDNTGGAEQVLDVETLTVAVEDAVLLPLTDTATITVTINGVNDLEDGDELAQVEEGSGVTALPINALANAVDIDGDTPFVSSLDGQALNGGSSSAAGSTGGTFTFDANGNVTFDTAGAFAFLDEGQSIDTSVTYEVADGQGGLVMSTYTVTVTGAAGDPIIEAMNDAYTVLETEGAGDTEGNVLDNDDLPFAASNLVVEVNGSEGAVGQWIDVAGGGRFMLMANGDIDFDAQGAYNALRKDAVATENLTYTVRSSDGQQPSLVSIFNGPNGLTAKAEIVELNGDLVVTVTVLEEGGDIGDIRGLFFDVADESLLPGMSATGADITDQEFDANGVTNLGGGNNVNGNVLIALGAFDGGVTSGTPGIGGDDIRSTTFALSHSSQALTLDLLSNQDMALRLTSVGQEGGSREDSLKLGSVALPSISEALVDTATVQINIVGLNEAPDAVDDVINTDENTAIGSLNIITGVDGNVDPNSMLGADSDPDGPISELSVTKVTVGGVDIDVPANGSASFTVTDTLGRSVDVTVDSAGNVSVATPQGFDATDDTDGSFSFAYELSDDDGGTDTAVVTINVDDLVEPIAPDAVNDVINTDENNGVTNVNIVSGVDGNVDPNSMLGADDDPDGDNSALTVTKVIVAGMDILIPAGGSNTFTVTDTLGRSVDVTVDSSGAVTVATPDGFDATDDTDGSFSFDYEIVDADGLTDVASVTINVDDLAEPKAPDAVDDVINTDEDTDVSNINIVTGVDGNDAPTTVLGADSDPDGAVEDLTVTQVTVGGSVIAVPTTGNATFTVDNASGQSADVSIDSLGNVSVTNITGFDATDNQDAAFTFDYTIVDNDGLTDTATVTLNIDDLEEPAASPEINVVFLLDASRSAVLGEGDDGVPPSMFESTDVNGDGQVGSHFDGSLTLMQAMIDKFGTALGSLGGDVDIGVYAFEGNNPEGTNALNDNGNTVFDLNTDYASIVNNYPIGAKFGSSDVPGMENDDAFFAPAMNAANTFFSANNASGSEAINLIYVLAESTGSDQLPTGPGQQSDLIDALLDTYNGDPADPDYGRPVVDTILFDDTAGTLGSALGTLEAFRTGPVEPALGDGVTNIVIDQGDVNDLLLTIADPLIDLVDEALGTVTGATDNLLT